MASPFQNLDSLPLKYELLRAFVLACSLEPLAEKLGCTTRHVDSSPGTKLEYFTVAAMNSGTTLVEIVDRTFAFGRQPDCVFDLAYSAQALSTRNRLGGKVNYAQILMLLPVMQAQALLAVEGKAHCDAADILYRASVAMTTTSELDVYYLQKFIDLATMQSTIHNLRIGVARKQLSPQFVGTCRCVMDATHTADFSHTMMATEIRDGYPVCLNIYKDLTRHDGNGLLQHSETVYRELLPQVLRPDIAADCLVVGIYLMLALHTQEVLFP